LPAPSGRWVIAQGAQSLLVARIAAGGETFDAKLAPVIGVVELEPAALSRSRARFEVPAASIDTGIDLRNGHARGYLRADAHPTIALVVPTLDAVDSGGATRSFTTRGELSMMGKQLEVALTGTLVVLDEAKRRELGVPESHALLVSASFTLAVTAAGLDRDNFDADDITLSGRFVLVPEGAVPGAGTL